MTPAAMNLSEIARGYYDWGFNPLPTNGRDKYPATHQRKLLWSDYQESRPTPEQLKELFSSAGGIGLLCGKTPGDNLGLAVIDVDTKNDPDGTIWQELSEAIRSALPGVWAKLSQCIVRTPSGGYHLHYRCSEMGRKQKFAGGCIELLEQGSFCVFPPTPGYSVEGGGGVNIDEIKPEEQATLISILRSIRAEDEGRPDPDLSGRPGIAPGQTQQGAEVWDLFNERIDGQEILLRNGWHRVKAHKSKVYYRRPGDTSAESSGNWDTDRRLFYCFSTSTPLPANKGLTAFALFNYLEHGDDWPAAARAARKLFPVTVNHTSGKTLPKATETPQERRTTPMAGEAPSAGVQRADEEETEEEFNAEMETFLGSNLITEDRPVKEPIPIVSVGGSTISTPRNITVIGGQAKSGKSAVVAAWIAGCIADPLRKPDTFGATISSSYGTGKAVIHFDTEQSEWDHVKLIKRIQRNSNLPKTPPNFLSITLLGLSATESRWRIERVLRYSKNKFGGIHSIWVDGVGDLLNDTNDLKESDDAVRQMMRWGKYYNCPLFAVIHHNPGSESTKGRGHLGSYLERKAEAVLSVKKDAEGRLATISADRLRNAGHFPPLAFGWDENGIPRSRDAEEVKQKAQREKHRLAIDALSNHRPDSAGLLHSDMVGILTEELGVSTSTAKNRIAALLDSGILIKNGKYYEISQG